MPGYRDSESLIKRSYYEKAERLSGESRFSEAVEAYRAAGDFEDAEVKLESLEEWQYRGIINTCGIHDDVETDLSTVPSNGVTLHLFGRTLSGSPDHRYVQVKTVFSDDSGETEMQAYSVGNSNDGNGIEYDCNIPLIFFRNGNDGARYHSGEATVQVFEDLGNRTAGQLMYERTFNIDSSDVEASNSQIEWTYSYSYTSWREYQFSWLIN